MESPLEVLVGPLVAAIIGSATLLLAFMGQRNKARVDEMVDIRERLNRAENRLAECEQSRIRLEAAMEELQAENVRLMRLLVK